MKYIIITLCLFFATFASAQVDCPDICGTTISGQMTCTFNADVFTYSATISPAGTVTIAADGTWTVDTSTLPSGNYTVTTCCECPLGCDECEDFTFRVIQAPDVTKILPSTPACGDNDGQLCFSIMGNGINTFFQISFDGGTTYEAPVSVAAATPPGEACYDLPAGTYNVWAQWANGDCEIEVGDCEVEEKEITVISNCLPNN